jgi:hypothetical protein
MRVVGRSSNASQWAARTLDSVDQSTGHTHFRTGAPIRPLFSVPDPRGPHVPTLCIRGLFMHGLIAKSFTAGICPLATEPCPIGRQSGKRNTTTANAIVPGARSTALRNLEIVYFHPVVRAISFGQGDLEG